jgi:hypothetical protein
MFHSLLADKMYNIREFCHDGNQNTQHTTVIHCTNVLIKEMPQPSVKKRERFRKWGVRRGRTSSPYIWRSNAAFEAIKQYMTS